MTSAHFLPSKDGLRFANQTVLKNGERFCPGGIRFGMCGGMCLVVLKRLRKSEPTPAIFLAETPPTLGSKDFFKLFYHQIKSLFPFLLFTLFWSQVVAMMGQRRRNRRITRQWENILKTLHKNSVVRICLIKRNGLFSKPWENHQVLAYGYFKTCNTVHHLKIYDPNHPLDDEVVMSMNTSGSQWGIDESTGERWSGLFSVR